MQDGSFAGTVKDVGKKVDEPLGQAGNVDAEELLGDGQTEQKYDDGQDEFFHETS